MTIVIVVAIFLMAMMHNNRRAENAVLCAYEAAEAADVAIEADREFVRQYRHNYWRYNLKNNSAEDYTEVQIDIIISQMEKEWQEALPSFSESE